MGSAESRMCTVDITNRATDYTLTNPRVYISSGHCDHALPPKIQPAETRRGVFKKTAHTASGSVGVFTYDLCKERRRAEKKLAIMFSVPFNYNLYSNMFAVGVFERHTLCDHGLYVKMYYNEQNGFVRRIANDHEEEFEIDDIIIKVTMTNTYQPTVTIDVDSIAL